MLNRRMRTRTKHKFPVTDAIQSELQALERSYTALCAVGRKTRAPRSSTRTPIPQHSSARPSRLN